jgi:hypothetical protein
MYLFLIKRCKFSTSLLFLTVSQFPLKRLQEGPAGGARAAGGAAARAQVWRRGLRDCAEACPGRTRAGQAKHPPPGLYDFVAPVLCLCLWLWFVFVPFVCDCDCVILLDRHVSSTSSCTISTTEPLPQRSRSGSCCTRAGTRTTPSRWTRRSR